MVERVTLLALGLGVGGAVVLGEATYILTAALGRPGGAFDYTVSGLPIGVPIAIISVLLAVGMIYVAVAEPQRLLPDG